MSWFLAYQELDWLKAKSRSRYYKILGSNLSGISENKPASKVQRSPFFCLGPLKDRDKESPIVNFSYDSRRAEEGKKDLYKSKHVAKEHRQTEKVKSLVSKESAAERERETQEL